MPTHSENLDHYYHAGKAYLDAAKKSGKDSACAISPGSAEWKAWTAWFNQEGVTLPLSFRQGGNATVPAQFPDWFAGFYGTHPRQPPKPPRRSFEDRNDVSPEERARVMEKWKKLTAGWVMRMTDKSRPEPREEHREAAE